MVEAAGPQCFARSSGRTYLRGTGKGEPLYGPGDHRAGQVRALLAVGDQIAFGHANEYAGIVLADS